MLLKELRLLILSNFSWAHCEKRIHNSLYEVDQNDFENTYLQGCKIYTNKGNTWEHAICAERAAQKHTLSNAKGSPFSYGIGGRSGNTGRWAVPQWQAPLRCVEMLIQRSTQGRSSSWETTVTTWAKVSIVSGSLSFMLYRILFIPSQSLWSLLPYNCKMFTKAMFLALFSLHTCSGLFSSFDFQLLSTFWWFQNMDFQPWSLS